MSHNAPFVQMGKKRRPPAAARAASPKMPAVATTPPAPPGTSPLWSPLPECQMTAGRAVFGPSPPATQFLAGFLSQMWGDDLPDATRRGIGEAILRQCVPWQQRQALVEHHMAGFASRIADYVSQWAESCLGRIEDLLQEHKALMQKYRSLNQRFVELSSDCLQVKVAAKRLDIDRASQFVPATASSPRNSIPATASPGDSDCGPQILGTWAPVPASPGVAPSPGAASAGPYIPKYQVLSTHPHELTLLEGIEKAQADSWLLRSAESPLWSPGAGQRAGQRSPAR